MSINNLDSFIQSSSYPSDLTYLVGRNPQFLILPDEDKLRAVTETSIPNKNFKGSSTLFLIHNILKSLCVRFKTICGLYPKIMAIKVLTID